VAKVLSTDADISGIALDVLDARDFRSGAVISTDPVVLGNGLLGHSMNGLATDGVAQLVLRVKTNHPGTVTFTISDPDGGAAGNASEYGELSSRTGTSNGATLAVQTETVGSGSGTGEFFAFARYRAPETLRSGVAADLSAAQRSLRLRVSFQPSDGTPPPAQPLDRDLTLARPPVVLIHGLASDSDTLQTFEDKLRARIPGVFVDAEVGDYRLNNRAHFSVNEAVPVAAVIRARNAYRNLGLAAVQADVFGHSMGGVLGRIAAGGDEYRRDSNYGEGDFNKLVTVDSPHHGSPWADAVVACRDNPLFWQYRPVCEAAAGIRKPEQAGAYEDLQTDSDALCQMRERETEVPAHVIVGDYRPPGLTDLADLACVAEIAIADPSLSAFCKLWWLADIIGVGTRTSVIFPDGGDLVVSADSQRYGLAASAAQVSVLNHVHMKFFGNFSISHGNGISMLTRSVKVSHRD
jgi:pimeloyl-ACP methyl ester carboxylesterase